MSSALQTLDASSHEKTAKLAELIADTRVCMVTTVDANGRLLASATSSLLVMTP